ncbi:MAG: hypothetical protein JNJ73_07730 [Hyphomonadaceae bacterium]|nr:hypothetical protein [Hyphomonadaceae bacterium]
MSSGAGQQSRHCLGGRSPASSRRMWKRFARFAVAAVAGGVLGGCAATTTTTATVAPTPAAAPAPTPLATLLARAGQADAPSLTALSRTFGQPDVQRREGAGAILTYRLESCALVLVFAADGRNEFRLSEASAQPARAEAQAPELAECAAAAEARHRTRDGTS